MGEKTKVLLIGHGHIGSGVLDSVELIYGKTPIIESIDTYTSSNFNLVETVRKIIDKHKNQNLIVITDLFGGSVNNEFLKYVGEGNFYLLTGMNLALVLELLTHIEVLKDGSVEDMIEHSIKRTKGSIKYCNKGLIDTSTKDDDF